MLMRAATLGNITLLQACLQAGIALDSKVDDGSTALHCAARAGQTLTVKLLIEMGADVGTTDIKSRSPLVQAILSGNPDTTNVLFENTTQGNLGKQMCHLENALARSGSIEIIENYIKSLQVTLESVDVVRILSIASSLGQDTTVAALLRRSNVDVNSLEYKGNAPIHAAARNGHTKVMELLLASDRIDLNVKTKRFQVTALHIATTRGHLELIKQLIDHEDVNVNCTDFYGRVPLHLSTEHGHLAVTDLLLRDKRTNTGCLDRLKQSPLQLAAFEQHWGVVDLLLSYHEDPRSYSLIQDLSPYQEAFVKADVVKRLLDHADFRDPSMLLHCVAEKGNCDVIQILSAQQSIDMNADCGWLGTPLMVTVFYNQIEAAKLLLRDKEIDVNRKFIGQNTALYWAKLRHHAKMVDLLLSHGATSGENDPPWPPASNEKASNIPPTTTPSAPKNNALESDHEVELEDLSDNDMDDMATAELDEFMSREHREMKE
jgi:ankyrin repeat protein